MNILQTQDKLYCSFSTMLPDALCQFVRPISEVCFDVDIRKKIADRGYTFGADACLLTIPTELVDEIEKAVEACERYLIANYPETNYIHYLPQTLEAEMHGLVCLRGLNRDSRDCDGYDCPLEIYDACVDMLWEGTGKC